MDTGTEVIKKLSDRTIEYFNDKLSLNVLDRYVINEVSSLELHDINIFINLQTYNTGCICMGVSNKDAISMVKQFVYGEIPGEDLKELAVENVAETLNITLGNILQDLEFTRDGGKVEISTPIIITNDKSIYKDIKTDIKMVKLELDKEIILLSYFNK